MNQLYTLGRLALLVLLQQKDQMSSIVPLIILNFLAETQLLYNNNIASQLVDSSNVLNFFIVLSI